ncbi:uncharacterized protein [Anomalospiza imberbis]|uniref:uncharacterized protein n=1 Tax=Anomalospiza imberbis TaxID=187417 RepID=UPI0035900082
MKDPPALPEQRNQEEELLLSCAFPWKLPHPHLHLLQDLTPLLQSPGKQLPWAHRGAGGVRNLSFPWQSLHHQTGAPRAILLQGARFPPPRLQSCILSSQSPKLLSRGRLRGHKDHISRFLSQPQDHHPHGHTFPRTWLPASRLPADRPAQATPPLPRHLPAHLRSASAGRAGERPPSQRCFPSGRRGTRPGHRPSPPVSAAVLVKRGALN